LLKFNMGCGQNHHDGCINVDQSPASRADEVWDLDVTPWPWPDSCASEVRFIHSLEHMGGDPKVFLAIMTELYRICAPEALVHIHVPHPWHDNFINDPTHVRAITPTMLTLFDRELNEMWREKGAANSPLALYTGVDFKVESVLTLLAEPMRSRQAAGEVNDQEILEAIQSQNNVIEEWRIALRARKPAP
jgi:hypothetical protein